MKKKIEELTHEELKTLAVIAIDTGHKHSMACTQSPPGRNSCRWYERDGESIVTAASCKCCDASKIIHEITGELADPVDPYNMKENESLKYIARNAPEGTSCRDCGEPWIRNPDGMYECVNCGGHSGPTYKK